MRQRLLLSLLCTLPALGSSSGFAQAPDTLHVRILEELRALRAEQAELKQRLGGIASGLSYVRSELEALKLALGDSVARRPAEPTALAIRQPAPERAPFTEAELDISSDPFKGSPDAPLVLVEFSDFECPFCGRYVRNTLPQLVSDYVESGVVKYVFKHYPLSFHPNARPAARAAVCAERMERFWAMHDTLFANQRALTADDLLGYADGIGLNVDAFSACLDDPATDRAVAEDMALASAVGFAGTPHFGIGYAENEGKSVRIVRLVSGAKPYAEFSGKIEELRADQNR